MNKITIKQLIRINATVTERDNVLMTESQMKKLKDVINSPYEQDKKFFYVYKSTIEKASKLGCEIYRVKPFDKGNGKTALLALLTLLDVNGFELTDYKNDLTELVEYIKEGNVDGSNRWIRNHLERNIYIMQEKEDRQMARSSEQ